ncbi:hypothetical protein J6590_063677 [Homalodisca vitripennis]|nr:hypothetical protein J6590_063677 [Homalodisca vitripennis]
MSPGAQLTAHVPDRTATPTYFILVRRFITSLSLENPAPVHSHLLDMRTQKKLSSESFELQAVMNVDAKRAGHMALDKPHLNGPLFAVYRAKIVERRYWNRSSHWDSPTRARSSISWQDHHLMKIGIMMYFVTDQNTQFSFN